MRAAVVLVLLAPALAGCLGATVDPDTVPAAAPSAFRYLCPGDDGEGGAEPCLSRLPRDDVVYQQPYVAIHPDDARIMAVGVQYSEPTQEVAMGVAAGDPSAIRLAVYVTEDGGATWREAFPPAPTMSDDPVLVGYQGDAALLFDDEGTLHVTALTTPGTVEQQVQRYPVVGDNGVRMFHVYHLKSDDLAPFRQFYLPSTMCGCLGCTWQTPSLA